MADRDFRMTTWALDNLGASDVRLDKGQWARLDVVSKIVGFPYDLLSRPMMHQIQFAGVDRVTRT